MAGFLLSGVLSIPTRAANLGGSCCADLEERIEELDSSAALKGNRKVSLAGSGGKTLSFGNGGFSLDLPSLGGVIIDSNGNPFAINGTQIATLDRTGFANADRAGLALTTGVVNALAVVLDGPTDRMASGLWAMPFGNFTSIDGLGALSETDQTLGGVLAGATFRVAPGLSLGLFGGAARAEFETEFSDSIETDYGLAGAYGRYVTSQLVVDFSLTRAWSSSDNVRVIASNIGPNPFEIARSDYDGWIVSPAISVGWFMPVGADTLVIPAIKMRGQLMQLDGYAETGSSANATIAERDLDHVEGRLELGFRKDVAAPGFAEMTVRASMGLSLIERFGDDDVTGRLLGTALTFSSGVAETEMGGYVGLGFDAALTPAITFFGDTEIMLSGDAQSIGGFVGFEAEF